MNDTPKASNSRLLLRLVGMGLWCVLCGGRDKTDGPAFLAQFVVTKVQNPEDPRFLPGSLVLFRPLLDVIRIQLTRHLPKVMHRSLHTNLSLASAPSPNVGLRLLLRECIVNEVAQGAGKIHVVSRKH